MGENKVKVLVAIDGSKNSERAVIEAKKYGQCVGAEITLLTIIDHLSGWRYGYLQLSKKDSDALEKAAQTLLDETLKEFDDFEGEVMTKIRKGNPADEILKEAEEGSYDLIVMGSKGLGAFSRTILGSVSNKVLNHTKTNVVIIK